MLTKKRINKLELWSSKYKSNKHKFDALKKFLLENHKLVNRCQREMALSHVANFSTATEKIYMLFTNSLRAAGGNNLTSSAIATKLLLKQLKPFDGEEQISWILFMKHLGIKTTDPNDFFNHLISYPNFKYKKAALFLIQLKYLQNSEYKIFSDLDEVKINKQIPLDIVIGETVSKMMKLTYEKRITSSDANKFNSWAEEIWKTDFILFEDIWFWGYFATETNSVKKKEYRKFIYNDAKFNTIPWIYPPKLEFIKPKIEEFISIVKSK